MKNNNKIRTSLFGYKKSEIDAKLNSYKNQIDSLNSEFQLVDGIKEENEALKDKIEAFERREGEVQEVLMVAREKSEDMMSDVKLQYAMELERLKLFRAKWVSAYEELKNKYHFEHDACLLEGVVTEVTVKIEELLNKDFGIALTPQRNDAERQLFEEAERLSISQDEINKLVEKLKSELKKAS